MTGRPEDGYETRARIQARSSGRGRLGVVLAGALVVAWAAVTAGRGPSNPTTSPTAPPASPDLALETLPAAGTFPPPIEIRGNPPPQAFLPVAAPGLGWLDAAAGVIQPGPSPEWQQWRFVGVDSGS